MKQLPYLLLCLIIVLSTLLGCQPQSSPKESAKVFAEDDSKFPEFLVGKWKGDKGAWEFIIEPDGSISSAVVNPGMFRLISGQTRTIPMKEDGEGIYVPGAWTVDYTPEEHKLVVEIVLDYVYLEFGPNFLEGSVRDVFIGKVSQDGKTWETERFCYPDYTVHGDKVTKLTQKPGEHYIENVKFSKVQADK